MGRTRGAQRDPFAARLETHRRRFWRQVANATAGAVATLDAQAIVLAGPAEAARALTDLLPATVRRRLAGAVAAAAYLTDAAIVSKAGPVVTRAVRARAAGLS
ncbi:MAG: hypothetical protein FJX78_02815 [Armatimonadetes bacterium]|nr:hypothetical protein [Armatimonadota bacterium]